MKTLIVLAITLFVLAFLVIWDILLPDKFVKGSPLDDWLQMNAYHWRGEAFKEDIMYRTKVEGTNVVIATLGSFWRSFTYSLKTLLCVVYDHKYEDHSNIGPDSGRELIFCERCGDIVIDHVY